MGNFISAAGGGPQNPPQDFLALKRPALPPPANPSLVFPPAYLYGRNSKPVISNRDADWNRLVVEEYHPLAPGELEFPPRVHHVITCQLAGPNRIVRRWDGRSDEKVFAPGDYSLCPAGSPAYVQWEGQAQILQVLVPARWFAETCALMGSTAAQGELRVVYSDFAPQLTCIGLALQSEIKSGCPGGTLYAETLATALAAFLIGRCSFAPACPKAYQRGLGKSDLVLVLAYIDDHLADELSLSELAACAHLSPYHFTRLFKLSTGCTPHRYVIRQRVEKAKSLLASGKLTIGEVAQAVGFFDHSNLSLHFKRLTGVSPRDFSRR